MSNNQKIDFLYQSIADTQSTIRAIDVKLGFLFVVAFLPVAGLEKIISLYETLKAASNLYFYSMLLFGFLWLASIYTLFKSTISISNPSRHVSGQLPKGIFYGGNIFTLNAIDNFFNFPVKSNQEVDQFSQDLPENEAEIIKELSFEKIKISYIREIKIRRSSLCGRLIFSWICLGFALWILYLLKVGF
ncbi:hypothetical protein [Parathalassolituus penaei]|uniref:Uncharacterized protein n=1 Tax=Parathalassolituus penaei TaxID=2997323 RepID=A0A9X3EE08_9GAMM|nr:hypothetical protein [Parathalassolituus penaei]MCY0965475.1 hypothetical protein [Parathalassolituus penaei]